MRKHACMVRRMGNHGHGHGHGAAPSDRRRLGWALAITAAVLLVEVVGTGLTGSLALLADAGHLATDVLGGGGALTATVRAQRPPSQMRTYGLGRAEVLAAALNALILLVVAGVVAAEAITPLSAPP